jgi:hypothetical protein
MSALENQKGPSKRKQMKRQLLGPMKWDKMLNRS